MSVHQRILVKSGNMDIQSTSTVFQDIYIYIYIIIIIIIIFIYLNLVYIYIEYNTNFGYKWTSQEVTDVYIL